WTDFQTAWMSAKKPYGATLKTAYDAARTSAERLDDSLEVGILSALCRNLAAADNTFYLSCRTVQELFGVGRMTAWRWFSALRFYGIIEPIKTGTLKGRQATTWRYVEQERARG